MIGEFLLKLTPLISEFNELNGGGVSSMESEDFSKQTDPVGSIMLKGSLMESPYGRPYAEYLKKLLESELRQCFFRGEVNNISITGMLLSDEFDETEVGVDSVDVSARFVVVKNGYEVYNKTHTIRSERKPPFFESGSISRIENDYPISIQKLLGIFFRDQELLSALKNKGKAVDSLS